jgi:hypothetical protein
MVIEAQANIAGKSGAEAAPIRIMSMVVKIVGKSGSGQPVKQDKR